MFFLPEFKIILIVSLVKYFSVWKENLSKLYHSKNQTPCYYVTQN